MKFKYPREADLKKLTDKELRNLAKSYKDDLKGVRKKLNTAYNLLWRTKDSLRVIQSAKRRALIERGKRKGYLCPALNKESYEYKCEARKGWTYGRNYEDIYAKFCASCRLNHEEARTKATLNKIGVK